MHLKQALASAIEKLTADHVPSPRMNAELLLMFVLSCDRAFLFAHPERRLTADEQSRYNAVLAERARGVPTQYITGHQEFWGMDLIVSPAVLIPRPETEHVIETALEVLSSSQADVQGPRSELRVADVGTGSGCIALALAKELPQAEIHAIDISSTALEIARANAARHQLERRIHFHQNDLLADLNGPFDLIVSNPPYVGDDEEDQVQLEVRKFEPRQAVFSGATGTEVISRLIPQANKALRPSGWLIFEISGTIADRVLPLLEAWDEVKLIRDLQSIPRVVQAKKPASSDNPLGYAAE
ncbi:MAG TPA: peptide chain release factor N(5)-glutamine methyltransferase [Candidatus Sulfotelmatobacter sp.]|nr:peptide chain release factor N(5)-glutamine methyltransferase [Candidatus Sulfotelmatobacter sp.]